LKFAWHTVITPPAFPHRRNSGTEFGRYFAPADVQNTIAKRLEGMKHFRILVAALTLTILQSATAAESLDQTIHFLLDHIAKSEAVFIRNGGTYTPPEAVEHIKTKYAHFQSQIKTPEDFIRLAASKSLLSGKLYTVRPRGGKEQPMSEWLTEALKEHRAAAGH
jgi:Family of unknown function (DUF5329)